MSGLLLATSLSTSAEVFAQEKSPNLLYIFPDQYRLTALSIWSDPAYKESLSTIGDPVHTPNLDKLAKQGVIFTQATSTHPLSSPYRGMLMTGMYPSENGIENNNCRDGREQGMHHHIETLTDVLTHSDYETAYIGKVHWETTLPLFDEAGNYVGTEEAPGGYLVNKFDTYVPAGRGRHGNKYWFQQITKTHFHTLAYSNRPELVEGKKDGEVHHYNRFSVELEAEIIMDYLKNNDGQRNASKPFSLFWALNPPHAPYSKIEHCKEEVYNKFYKDLSFDEVIVRENISYGDKTQYKKKENLALNAKVYFSLIKSIDDEVGKVLAILEEEGLADNTIVVFTSDHGEMMGSHGSSGKNSYYDEAFLVPFIIRYPGKIAHHTNNLMFGPTDIMPTLLSMMGLESNIPASVMGADYSDGIMTGEFVKNQKPTSALYLNNNKKGVRTNSYTYVVDKNGEYVLYNNLNDPYQTVSLKLHQINTSDAQFLKQELGQWLIKAKDGWAKQRMFPSLIAY